MDSAQARAQASEGTEQPPAASVQRIPVEEESPPRGRFWSYYTVVFFLGCKVHPLICLLGLGGLGSHHHHEQMAAKACRLVLVGYFIIIFFVFCAAVLMAMWVTMFWNSLLLEVLSDLVSGLENLLSKLDNILSKLENLAPQNPRVLN